MKYAATTAHSSDADISITPCESLKEALDIITDFAKGYNIIIKNGKLYDSDNDSYDTVTGEIKNNKIFSFIHADGEGPIGKIDKIK